MGAIGKFTVQALQRKTRITVANGIRSATPAERKIYAQTKRRA